MHKRVSGLIRIRIAHKKRERSQHRPQILFLTGTLEVHRLQYPSPAVPQPRLRILRKMDGSAVFRCRMLKYWTCLRKGLPYHDRHSPLDYARLFTGYLFKGIAEQVAMVEADGCNHGKVRSDYVGTVQTASEPHLEHDCGCPAFGKPFHRHSGGNLEKRERKPLEHLAVCDDKIIYPGLVRHPASSASHHLHPFAEIPDMR